MRRPHIVHHPRADAGRGTARGNADARGSDGCTPIAAAPAPAHVRPHGWASPPSASSLLIGVHPRFALLRLSKLRDKPRHHREARTDTRRRGPLPRPCRPRHSKGKRRCTQIRRMNADRGCTDTGSRETPWPGERTICVIAADRRASAVRPSSPRQAPGQRRGTIVISEKAVQTAHGVLDRRRHWQPCWRVAEWRVRPDR